MTEITRRALIQKFGATALTAGAFSMTAGISRAQAGELVIGASLPLTGGFAFAGIAIERGIQDYLAIVNESGGIAGRKVRLAFEDTGYKPDASVAVYNKLTSQNQINLYYGDSTGFAKAISPELGRTNKILMGGASFASELNNPEKFPNIFMAGPDYSNMIGILMKYIATKDPGSKIVLVNSDTEFGRDPIAFSRSKAAELGLKIVAEIITQPTAADISTEVLRLRQVRPDYVLFHGYVLAPLPEFISQAKQLGLKAKFMGTFWSMDSSLWDGVGEVADGFMGIMPYRYYYDSEPAPMLEKIRKMRPEYQATGYMQGMVSAMFMLEAAKRVLESGKELNGRNLKSALNTIQDFDTGGLIGVPASIYGNSVPIGRIYQYSAAERKMLPVSDWIDVASK